jgi:hypothetical protein
MLSRLVLVDTHFRKRFDRSLAMGLTREFWCGLNRTAGLLFRRLWHRLTSRLLYAILVIIDNNIMAGLLFDFASLSAARSLRKIQEGNDGNAKIERIRAFSELLDTTDDPATRTTLEWALQRELRELEESRLWAQKNWWEQQMAMAVGPLWILAIVGSGVGLLIILAMAH